MSNIVIEEIDDLTSPEMVKKGFNPCGYMTKSVTDYFDANRERHITAYQQRIENTCELMSFWYFGVYGNYNARQIIENGVNFEMHML